MEMLLIDGNNWFHRNIEKSNLKEMLEILQPNPHQIKIVIWDGVNSRSKRQEIYPEYKKHRKLQGESFYEIQKLFKKLLSFINVLSIEVPNYEADDIIANLVCRYKNSCEIIIDSTDADFIQLDVSLTSFKSLAYSAKDARLYKTLVGDTSDNIKGIYLFGDSAWYKQSLEDKLLWVSYLQGQLEIKDLNWKTIPDKCHKWLSNLHNQQLLRKYYEIIGFIPINSEEVDNNTKQGHYNPQAINEILKEVFL